MRQRLRLVRRLRHCDVDRGSVTVEAPATITLMLLALLVGVQVVMWLMAAVGAHYTANHAAQTSRLYGSSAAAGQDDANVILTSAVGSALNDPTVTVTRTATTVTVTVRGTAFSIIAGFRPPVSATVQAPLEMIN